MRDLMRLPLLPALLIQRCHFNLNKNIKRCQTWLDIRACVNQRVVSLETLTWDFRLVKLEIELLILTTKFIIKVMEERGIRFHVTSPGKECLQPGQFSNGVMVFGGHWRWFSPIVLKLVKQGRELFSRAWTFLHVLCHWFEKEKN